MSLIQLRNIFSDCLVKTSIKIIYLQPTRLTVKQITLNGKDLNGLEISLIQLLYQLRKARALSKLLVNFEILDLIAL